MLHTPHGPVETPIFMPVGTVGTVKGLHWSELGEDIKARIVLGNTYHLYLRPGMEIMQKAGGLHKFTSWDGPMLTDSGGYQVYSLAHRSKITEEGVKFQSHIDGSRHLFTAENVMDVQRQIGADIIMAFDECAPWPCEKEYARQAMGRTHRWLKRCFDHLAQTEPLYGYEQALFPIVQGSTFLDLREESAEFIAKQDAIGNAIGGLSVGEPHEDMYAMTELVTAILPKEKPRYLMGVGTPANILESVARGVDMFDCVMPTRNGRKGMIFTKEGIMNMRNRKWADEFSELDPHSSMALGQRHSKAYVRHLMVSGELLGGQICSLLNLGLYLDIVRDARQHIIDGTFGPWKDQMVKKLVERL